MCGIIWTKMRNDKPAIKKLRKLYHAQKHRGQLGFGYVEIGKKVGELNRTCYEEEIFKTLSKSKSNEVLFHHRFPTSTPNTPNTAHPIPVDNAKLKYGYYGVHNGVISNPSELKKAHEKDGYEYTTELRVGVYAEDEKMFYDDTRKGMIFNDSEALIVDLTQAIESDADKIMARGSIAFIMLQYDKATRKPLKLFYGRNTSPLMMEINNSYIKLSSAGSGEEVEAHKLHCYDYVTGEIVTIKDFQIGDKPVPARAVEMNSTSVNKHYHGRRWSDALQCYVNDSGVSRGMGYDTTSQRTLPAPRVHATIDPDNEADYEFEEIPGYKNNPLSIELSNGTEEFYTVSELDECYANVIETCAYWQDKIMDAVTDGDKAAVEDAKAALQIWRLDESKLKHVINQIYSREKSNTLVITPTAKTAEPLI